MIKGTLIKWHIERDFGGGYVVVGTLVSRSEVRAGVTIGKVVRTSTLRSIDFENKIAVTQNSEYELLDEERE